MAASPKGGGAPTSSASCSNSAPSPRPGRPSGARPAADRLLGGAPRPKAPPPAGVRRVGIRPRRPKGGSQRRRRAVLEPAPAGRGALGPGPGSVSGSESGAGTCAMSTMGAAVSGVADASQRVHPWVAEGARRVRFGVIATGLADWGAARACAQAVEGLGFDSLWTGDHPAFGTAGWPTLGALAQATRTLRLGTLVSCVHYWNPVVLA